MKTIQLTELKVAGMFIDILNQKVIVNYQMLDADGTVWVASRQETYWVTPPDPAGPTDQQLPAQYLQTLVDLYTAAKADLEARYLI